MTYPFIFFTVFLGLPKRCACKCRDSWCDSSISSIYENPSIFHAKPLEVHGYIPNPVVQSESSGIGGCFVECRSNPPSLCDGNEEGGFHALAYMEKVDHLDFSIQAHNKMEVALTSQMS